jgi:hypothetical protein
MPTGELRRNRIDRMIALAQAYRGWTSGELCEALGREPRRAAPGSGNPKLDLIARLADALDWEVGEVAESVWDPSQRDTNCGSDGVSFDALDDRAQQEHRRGRFREMEATGLAMRRIARDARERAIAANRLAGAYDGLGRYPKVLDCVREGLAERGIGGDLRLMLTVNLANANYTLWNLQESQSISTALLEQRFAGASLATTDQSRLQRVGRAFCHAIRGHSERRMLPQCEGDGETRARAQRAITDLTAAERLYEELAADFGDHQYMGLSNTARGGILEARVAAGELDCDEAVQTIIEHLDEAVRMDDGCGPDVPSVHTLESWGWWSIFGANIALRGGSTEARPHSERSDYERALAICTNKAAEIADHLDSWSMRERAFTLEWFRRQDVAGDEGPSFRDWMLDTEDVRVLVGTMGRFPLFRATGWRILDRATLVGPCSAAFA